MPALWNPILLGRPSHLPRAGMALWRRVRTATPEQANNRAAATRTANSDLGLFAIRIAVHAVLDSVNSHLRIKCVGPRVIPSVTSRRRARGIHRAVQRMRLLLTVSFDLSLSTWNGDTDGRLTGQSCGANGLACASGQCTSLNRAWLAFFGLVPTDRLLISPLQCNVRIVADRWVSSGPARIGIC